MKRSPLKRGNKPLKRRKRLAHVSMKRKLESKDYNVLKDHFLKSNPICQCEDCLNPSTDIHHKARRGKFYLRTDTWMAVCRSCHDKIELNGIWAKIMGYTFTPEQRRLLS